jgi:hypothetical protein
MGHHTLQFGGGKFLNECRIVEKAASIRCHGREIRRGDQLEPQAKRSEKRLIEEELGSGARELIFNGQMSVHDAVTTVCFSSIVATSAASPLAVFLSFDQCLDRDSE